MRFVFILTLLWSPVVASKSKVAVNIAEAIAAKMKQGATPFQVVNDVENGGELSIRTANSYADLSQHTPEMVEELSTKGAEMVGDSPFYLSTIEASGGKGLGTKTLKQAEHAAFKNGADSIYLQADASISRKYGQQGKSQAELEKFYEKNGYVKVDDSSNPTAPLFIKKFDSEPLSMDIQERAKRAAEQGFTKIDGEFVVNPTTGAKRSLDATFDPRFKDSANILALSGQQAAKPSLSPLPLLGKAYRAYDEYVQQPVDKLSTAIASKIAGRMDLTKDKSATPGMTEALGTGISMVADPLNFVPVGKVAKVAQKVTSGAVKPSTEMVQAAKIATDAIKRQAQNAFKSADLTQDTVKGASLVGQSVFGNQSANYGRVLGPNGLPLIGRNALQK